MSSNTPTPLQGGTSSSLKGWNALTRALAADIPTALRRSQRLRHAASSELARIGKRR